MPSRGLNGFAARVGDPAASTPDEGPIRPTRLLTAMSAEQAAGDQPRDDDAADDTAPDGEVGRGFILGLLALGVLLFGLFVWVTLAGNGATPL